MSFLVLPCFEDAKVGAAGGPLSVYIPPERRDPDIITPWEVAGTYYPLLTSSFLLLAKTKVLTTTVPSTGTKYLFGGRGGGTAYWVADKWTWCLAGCTWLARTAIFQDPGFISSFTNDQWNGKPLNSGGDNFITRYLHQHGHIIAVQYDDAATVWRTVKSSSTMIDQRLR